MHAITLKSSIKILNKITPEKFDKLSQELLDLGLESEDVLTRVLLLIFNKALDDYKYSCMYAKLCKVINDNVSKYYEQNYNKNVFKILLLKKCKEEYENRCNAFEQFENQNGPLSVDDEEKRSLAKQKMLCNIKFICELGKQQLLPKNILHDCIKQLLSRAKNQSFADKMQDLECLCEIMKNIGHLLETNEKASVLLDQYFDRMNTYSKSSEINSRIKFMLLDVIDLRKNNWIPRQKDVLHSSISEKVPEKDNNGLLSPYGTLYHMHHLRHGPFMNQGRVDDMFSPMPIGPIYLGTGPGAINDHNFGSWNNPRRPNYNQKNNVPYSSGNNYPPQSASMNMMMKRDNQPNYRPNYPQHNNSGNNNANNYNMANNANNQNNAINGSNMMNNPRETPVNLPPRFQKQMKQTQNLPFMKAQHPQQQNNNDDHRMMPMMKPPMINDNNNRQAFNRNPPNPFQKPNNSFSKFMNPTKLNGKDLANDVNQMRLDDTNMPNSGNSGSSDDTCSKDEPVNLFFEIEKLLSEYYDSEKSEPIIQFLKTTSANFDEILLSIMRISIGKSEKERELTNQLLNKIKSDQVVNDQIFLSSLKNLFSKINELEVETPRARSYVAAYIANAITENVIILKEIGDLLDGGQHYPLFPLILQNLHKAKGQSWLFDIFSESKINLMQMVPEPDRNKERMADILEDRNLTFLYPMLRIESDITKQITSDCSPSSLYRWLKDNVNTTLQNSTEFISVVFSTLLKHIIAKHNNPDNPFVFTSALFVQQENELKKYCQVLQKFLSGKHDLQLVVLYSLQTYCHDHNFPKGLIEKWFNMLYEQEIVDDEVFFKWREDINEEYPGKGKALFQVNKWLIWLEEDDEEEEEE
ncbi:dihydrolipoyllysine-residue succinyltransferase [Dermatophagoides farinae]|uniref:Eukaryotic translation initiation factor 4 gamma 2 n=1 Tax=Dermatophagoides farinae TaxID=6954 RepID=A0A9D4P964_DERFA|nr:dihydrolipoyllysine-residue succinyltransferase [Dermatophagoides farinae]